MSLREDIWKAFNHHRANHNSPDVIEMTPETLRTIMRETGFPESDLPARGNLFGMEIRVVEGLPWDFAILEERLAARC